MSEALHAERKKLNRGIFYSTIKYGVNIVSALAYSVLASRVFGAELMGMFYLLMTFIGIFNIVTNLGEQGGLVRIVNKYQQRDSGVTALLLVFLAVSFVFTLVMMIPFGGVSWYLLSNVYHKPDLIVPFWVLTFSYLFFNNTSSVVNNIYIAFQEMKYSLIVEIILTAIKIGGVFLGLALFSKSVMAVVSLQVLIDISQFALLLFFLGRVITLRITLSKVVLAEAWQDLKEVLLFGIRLMPKNYNYLITEYVDRSLIPMFLANLAMLGFYVTAYMIFSKIIAFSAVFCKMLFPSLSRMSLQDNVDHTLTLFEDSVRKLLILMTFIVAVGAAFADVLMSAFGPEFAQAGVVLMILLPGLLAEVFSVTSSTLIQAMNRPGIVSIYSFAGAGVNALLNVLLIPVLGIKGAALANTAGLFLMAVCFYVHACKIVGQPLLKREHVLAYLKLLALGSVLFALGYALQLALPQLYLLPVWGVVFLLCYLYFIHALQIQNLTPLLTKLTQIAERTRLWQRAYSP